MVHYTCHKYVSPYIKVIVIIIYLCTETQHYCLLTGGAVKLKSGPLWFWGPAQNYPYCYSDNSDAIPLSIFLISYSNNVLSPWRHFLRLQVGELIAQPLEKLIIGGRAVTSDPAHFAQLNKSALIAIYGPCGKVKHTLHTSVCERLYVEYLYRLT